MQTKSVRVLTGVCAGVVSMILPAVASAAYSESVSGDLSGNYLAPTAVALTPDALNAVTGSIAGAGEHVPLDIDYFTVTVPAGQYLTNLFVRAGTTGGETGAFIGLFPGTAGTNPATENGTGTLGYFLYGAGLVDTDILDDMQTFNFMGAFPSQGFSRPLPAGQYTFWMQEGTLGTFNYSFDLQLSSVPEPTAAAAMLAGAGLLALRRRRVS